MGDEFFVGMVQELIGRDLREGKCKPGRTAKDERS
jgi:hypothetical protein